MIKKRLFVIEIDHEKGTDKIRIFCKDENDQKYIIEDNYQYYIYVLPKKDVNLEELVKKIKTHPKVKKIEILEKKYIGKKRKVLKVFLDWKDVQEVKDFIKSLPEVEGKKEIDINPHRKYIVDRKIFPFHWYEFVLEEKGEIYGIKRYLLKEYKLVEDSKKEIRVLAFDIEVYSQNSFPDPKKDPIISIAFYSENFGKVITWRRPEKIEEYYTIVENEIELIEEFEKTIREFDPDILTGYNSNNFDLYYIYSRAKNLGIELNLGWDRSGLKMLKKRKEDKKFRIVGIPHIDIYEFIVNIFGSQLQLVNFTLNEVAREILGEEKIELGWDEMTEYWYKKEHIDKILEYNLKDAELTYKILEKYLDIILELTRIVGQNLIDVAHMTYGQLVEWYLIKRSRDFDEIVPNRPKQEDILKRRMITYKGAFVLQPKPGFYKNIVVLDFRSLYPSIIIRHNVSIDTLNCEHEECKKENSIEIILTSGREKVWFCKKVKGFVPTVLNEVFTERAKLKKILKNLDKRSSEYKEIYAKQYALKILANSTYGYMGFPNSRWYCIKCAAAITSWGRKYLTMIAEDARNKGFEVIYGDTDSIFIKVKDKKSALEFLEEVNKKLEKPMELELEDFYISGIFVSKRGELEGAKKKYALLSETGSIKLRGFETIRRDWAPIAKKIQRKVIEIILKEGDIKKAVEYVRTMIKELKEHKIPKEDLIIHEQLRKDLSEYKANAPHVKIAKELKRKGVPVGPGTVVKYIITKYGDKIIDKARLPEEVREEDYDAEYYINNQILPAIEKIFEAVGVTKEMLITKKQKSLSDFFK